MTPQRICLAAAERNLGEPVGMLAPLVRAWLERGGQHLAPGREQADLVVALSVAREALRSWDENGHAWRAARGEFVVRIGRNAEETVLEGKAALR